ncbi:MAG TPA: polysaccharide deacetylase family protein [Candidatus Hypogeohydataceae bacterium YC41]
MRILADLGLRVISLGEVRDVLSGTVAPEPLVSITFDDGFRNIYEYGLPVLERYGFTATVFLVTDYCGRTNSWPSQPARIVHQPLLSWAEIRAMNAAGITFGSHTRTHPDLRRLPSRDVKEELLASKEAIENVTGRPVDLLAYPYGAYNETVKHLAEAHFTLACSTRLDFARPGSDFFSLERLDMHYFRHLVVFRHLFSRKMDFYIRLRQVGRDFRRWILK